MFQFCSVIGLHCLGGPGLSSRSVKSRLNYHLFIKQIYKLPVYTTEAVILREA